MSLKNLKFTDFEKAQTALSDGGVVGAVENLHGQMVSADGTAIPDIPGWICTNWGWIKIALIILKLFTPDEIDEKIDKIIEVGEEACS